MVRRSISILIPSIPKCMLLFMKLDHGYWISYCSAESTVGVASKLQSKLPHRKIPPYVKSIEPSGFPSRCPRRSLSSVEDMVTYFMIKITLSVHHRRRAGPQGAGPSCRARGNVAYLSVPIAAWAAATRATGTRKGEQLT